MRRTYNWKIKSELLSDGSETFNIQSQSVDVVLHAKSMEAAISVAQCLKSNTVD